MKQIIKKYKVKDGLFIELDSNLSKTEVDIRISNYINKINNRINHGMNGIKY